jgi:NAD(P)-dependent dehydrogenase (short-subunit alcohol dehydrogenase family)
MASWGVDDIPSQQGMLAVVTGATGGLGYETALALAAARAEVVVVGRSAEKGRDALRRIVAAVPAARVTFELADLASLASIAAFAARMLANSRPIDRLVNNAGVMAPPTRGTTVDGFEIQLGTNFLGHFALTARLLPLLRRAPSPRVVTVSSLAHRIGRIAFDDLQSARRYRPFGAYAQSKLADLLFTFELQRRSDAHGWGLLSDGAHPGYARTDLVSNGLGSGLWPALVRGFSRPFSQSAAEGALPILYAATSPDAEPGGYYGPRGLLELTGAVGVARVERQARDAGVAGRLWDVALTLTGVDWESGAA